MTAEGLRHVMENANVCRGKESKQMTSGCPLVFFYLTECCKEMWIEIEQADDRKMLSVCWRGEKKKVEGAY